MATPLHVLLVEDSDRDAELVQRHLRRGWSDVVLSRVETAAEMEAELDQGPWNLVIADYNLPTFSAVAALEVLKQRNLELPLIIVSGSISEEVAVACMRQGAADYLLKDRLGRLVEAVSQTLEHERVRDANRQAKAALRAAEERLRAVVLCAPISLFALNREGVFTLFTGGGTATLGLQPEDHIGKTIFALYADQPDIISHFQHALMGEARTTISRQNGNVVELRWIPERNAMGSVTSVIGVGIDVTEHSRVQAEIERARAAAEELAQVRSDFVAAVSHELNTPLTVLLGYAELLMNNLAQRIEPKWFNMIERIIAAGHRQQRLVSDLLLLSRLETEALEPQCEPNRLAPLVHRAATEVQSSYQAQRVDMDGSEDLRALVDSDRTLQILANLVDNAAKCSPPGSPVAVSWSLEATMAVVRVRDFGPGISEQGRQYLFTRFGRLPGSQMREGRVGTGLGLYLGRQMAHAMGGDLELEATGAQGSTMRLRLPAVTD
jgi:PAS domain S-box-containing protein